MTGNLTVDHQRTAIDDDRTPIDHQAQDRQELRNRVHPHGRLDLLINDKLVDHAQSVFRRECMSLIKNSELTAIIGQRTAKDQAALFNAGVKGGRCHDRTRRGQVSRDAYPGKNDQRNDTAGENSRTPHELSPL